MVVMFSSDWSWGWRVWGGVDVGKRYPPTSYPTSIQIDKYEKYITTIPEKIVQAAENQIFPHSTYFQPFKS